MDRKKAISRAKDKLTSSPELNERLSRVGFVRVMPRLDMPTAFNSDAQNKAELSPLVTFTIEETPTFGKRLMAEYQGVKEFVA